MKQQERKHFTMNETNQSRWNQWNAGVGEFSDFARNVGQAAGILIGSFAEVGQFIPLLEIVVTIGAFWRAGGGHIEVVVGVVFAQIVALFLVNHYAGVAMHWVGQSAIYLSVILGAVNTGFAISYAMSGGVANVIMADFVGTSSALAIAMSYVAKFFTHEAVANRLLFKAESEAAISELKRKRRHERETAAARDAMQLARINLQQMAVQDLTNDDRMATIQRRAMASNFVGEIMEAFEIDPRTRLGKDLILEANKIAGVPEEPAAAPLPPLRPIPQPSRNGSGSHA